MKILYRSLLTFVVSLAPVLAQADGAIMPEPGYYMYETAQTAAIFYESDTQTETLVVGMTYQGTAKEFAWMIPTPSKPEVERGSRTLFSEISDLMYGEDYYDYSYYPTAGVLEEEAVGGGVTVVEEKQVDYYDVTVLEATSSQDLLDWLNTNGYQFPSEKKYILNDYVAAGWFFTALKINADSVDKTVAEALRTGQAVPVQLTFTTANMVYPLRISAVTDDASTYQTIDLYIFDDHKVEANQFYDNYGDWVKQDEITQLAHDTNGNSWVEPADKKYFLTYLSANLSAADMTDDVFPFDADNNDTTSYSSSSWDAEEIAQVILLTIVMTLLVMGGVIISPIGWVMIAATIIRAKAKSGWRVAAQVAQWLVVLFTMLVSVLSVVATWNDLFDDLDYVWEYGYDKSNIGAAFGLALGIFLVNVILLAIPVIQSIVRWRRTKSS